MIDLNFDILLDAFYVGICIWMALIGFLAAMLPLLVPLFIYYMIKHFASKHKIPRPSDDKIKYVIVRDDKSCEEMNDLYSSSQ